MKGANAQLLNWVRGLVGGGTNIHFFKNFLKNYFLLSFFFKKLILNLQIANKYRNFT
jgi:hypothetical protein